MKISYCIYDLDLFTTLYTLLNITISLEPIYQAKLEHYDSYMSGALRGFFIFFYFFILFLNILEHLKPRNERELFVFSHMCTHS